MHVVRAHHKVTGEIIPDCSADQINKETRHNYDFTCLDPGCNAQFYWRGGVRPAGNATYLVSTFIQKNAKEFPHKAGCIHAYTGPSLFEEREYYDDGKLHFRLNFPIGGGLEDISPPIDRHFSHAVKGDNLPKPYSVPVDSLRKLVDRLEKEYGSLHDVSLEKTDFEYQQSLYKWSQLFIGADHYTAFYQAAYGQGAQRGIGPRLIVLKPSHFLDESEKGKFRFVCDAGEIRRYTKRESLKPVLVCEDEVMAGHMQRVIDAGEAVLIASRPFGAREHRVVGEKKNRNVVVYVTARQVTQLARIDSEKYWRPQMDLFAGAAPRVA